MTILVSFEQPFKEQQQKRRLCKVLRVSECQFSSVSGTTLLPSDAEGFLLLTYISGFPVVAKLMPRWFYQISPHLVPSVCALL